VILIINICKEPLHFYEFVKPVADIVSGSEQEALIVHHKDLTPNDLKKSDKVIICGTSLKDNEFMKNKDKFIWIKSHRKPILGICGGAHLIGLALGGNLKRGKEIGLKSFNFKRPFLGVRGKKEVYHLHQFYVLPETFHKDNFYATLFHPEVRNKEIIEEFISIS